jgi:nitrogen fixation NifU-like protein
MLIMRKTMTDDEVKSIYSDLVVDHACNPRNYGELKDSDGFARITGPCGDTMEIWLQIKGDIITDASFQTEGCAATVACGSMATELIKGKNLAVARSISQQKMLDSLHGLPEGNMHCALLAANTVKDAVRDYMKLKKEPWKRPYRSG